MLSWNTYHSATCLCVALSHFFSSMSLHSQIVNTMLLLWTGDPNLGKWNYGLFQDRSLGTVKIYGYTWTGIFQGVVVLVVSAYSFLLLLILNIITGVSSVHLTYNYEKYIIHSSTYRAAAPRWTPQPTWVSCFTCKTIMPLVIICDMKTSDFHTVREIKSESCSEFCCESPICSPMTNIQYLKRNYHKQKTHHQCVKATTEESLLGILSTLLEIGRCFNFYHFGRFWNL